MITHSTISKFIHKHAFSIGVFGVLFGFTFLAGSFVVANGQTVGPDDSHIVSLYINGEETVVPTRAQTVGELLDKSDIPFSEHDLVEPAKDTRIDADNFRVNVYKARPVSIVDGAKVTRVFSPYQGPKLIAEKAGVTVYQEDKYILETGDSFVEERIVGEKITIDRATPVNATIFGVNNVIRTHSKTVKEFLAEKGIVLGTDDRISVPVESAITKGMNISIWREGKQTITIEESIDAPVKQVFDSNQPITYKNVQNPGKEGKKTVTYEIIIRDGKEFSRIEISSIIISEPEEKIIVVGTRNNYSSSLNEWLHALRQCESGGIYTRNTGNGFYGAYQFMYSTWNRIATKIDRDDLVGVRPDLASPADQDLMIIANTKLSSQGLASQNPGCYRKLGLSQFPPAQ